MSEDVTPAAPAGWYAHPTMAGTQRYWDGREWTDHIAPATVAAPQIVAARQEVSDGMLLAGWLMAILFPIGGFIVGCIVLAKGKPGQGVFMMLMSFIAFMVWANILWASSEPSYY